MEFTALSARARDALAHPALSPLLAVVLAAFTVATNLGRRAFDVPFLLVWAIFVGAFYLGWAAWEAARRVGDRWPQTARRAPRWRIIAGAAAIVLVALAVGLAWYLVSRRAIGGVDRPTAIWASAITVLAVVLGAAARWRRPTVSGIAWLLPVQVLAIWIALRGYLLTSNLRLYDFEVYVAGGRRFVDGAWPYLTAPLDRLPPTAADDVFLYPPPLLAFFGWLSGVPEPLRSQAWIALILLVAIPAFRLVGVSWPYVAALVLFPPMIKGVESGNVGSVSFLLFAAGAFVPALLPIGVLFKPQFAIPSLWLLRERRWGSVLLGAAAVLLIVALSAALMGVELWIGWVQNLRHREASQHVFPELFGYSLAQYMPLAAFAALSLVAVAVPLLMRGTRSLAGLGLATIIASPSLWPHGFAFALPAVFALEAPLVWFALGVADGPWLWIVAVVGYLGLFFGRWDRGDPVRDATHPMVGSVGPWERPSAPTDRR